MEGVRFNEAIFHGEVLYPRLYVRDRTTDTQVFLRVINLFADKYIAAGETVPRLQG